MISIGKSYAPTGAKVTKNGDGMIFSIPQSRKVKGGGYTRDGFINVAVKGLYSFHKGDRIEITKITGASRVAFNDTVYLTLFAEIEYTTAEQIQMGENRNVVEENIPDDLF